MALPADELSPRRAGVRTPPHNLDVEESLLGAMLLSRDAISDAVEVVRADDFYKPSHGHVFDAITSLFSAGEPVDPVTVSAELQRADLLDAIGGPAKLVSMQSATPAISNAGRYARIIEEHALLRRLIGVAGDIAELGYDIPDDVTKVIDTAEQLVFDVAQRRVTDSMAPIRDLLAENLDRLEALYDRGDSITGVPTGYHDLDELLSGLQPNALYVVGARPAMGKALALDTPIPTPTGWTTMGELQVGHQVLDERGNPARVTYRSPVYLDRDCYEVVFDDGSVVVADAEHNWWVVDGASADAEPQVVTTAEMVGRGLGLGTAGSGATSDGAPGDGWRWSVPVAESLDLAAPDMPVDPYVLGCWIAGGCGVAPVDELHPDDPHHFRLEFESAGYGPGRRILARELQQLGLLGGAPPTIPARYLRGAAKQRQALLEGIMDTEGRVVVDPLADGDAQGGSAHGDGARGGSADGDSSPGGGTVELVLADRTVLAQVRELVCSLGGRPGPIEARPAGSPDGDTFDSWALRWVPTETLFRLSRKARSVGLHQGGPDGHRPRPAARSIVDVLPTPSVPVSCITVDAPSHLYLAGESFVPTHNTSFALGMATHAALESHRPVLFFSLEMSQLELTQRIVCAEARVDSSRVRNGKLVESDWNKIAHATGRLAEAPLWIDDNPNLTIMEIRSKARRLKSRVGDLGMVVIDYLQLMTGRSSAENRQVEVSEISRGLKILARELETPVVALSQLSRGLELRADKRPVLADLRESGSIEQDADVVMFIYRDEIYNADSADRGTAEIIVSKHRNGPTGVSRLAFLDHYARYANMAKGV